MTTIASGFQFSLVAGSHVAQAHFKLILVTKNQLEPLILLLPHTPCSSYRRCTTMHILYNSRDQTQGFVHGKQITY